LVVNSQISKRSLRSNSAINFPKISDKFFNNFILFIWRVPKIQSKREKMELPMIFILFGVLAMTFTQGKITQPPLPQQL